MAIVAALLAAILAAPAAADSAGVLDRIRQQGEIRLAYRNDAAPFSYRDEGGAPAGYSVALCREVADAIKTQLQLPEMKITYVPVSVDERFDAIAKGRADLLCEATTETLSRRQVVDFSIPTFLSGASLMILSGGPDSFAALADKKVGVLRGTTTLKGLETFLHDRNLKAEIVTVKTHAEGFKLLESGAISAYFGDRTILQYHMIKDAPGSNLMLADEYLSVEPYALALPHDPAFRLAVDRALSRLYRSGGMEKIFAKSFGDKANPSSLLSALYKVSGLPE